MPTELAAEVPQALARYESEFAWDKIPYSIKYLKLDKIPTFVHNNKYYCFNYESKDQIDVYDQRNNLVEKIELPIINFKFATQIGKFMAVYIQDNNLIQIWDLDNRSLISETASVDNVSALTISHQGDYIFCGLTDGRINIVETANPNRTIFINVCNEPIKKIQVSNNGKIAIVASQHICIAWQFEYLGDTINANEMLKLNLNNLHDLQLTANGRYLIITDSKSFRANISIFDIFEKHCVQNMKFIICNFANHYASSDSKIFFTPTGESNLLGNSFNFDLKDLRLISACNGKIIKTFKCKDLAAPIQADAFDALYVGKNNGNILLVNRAKKMAVEISLNLKEKLEDTLEQLNSPTCLLS